MENTANPTTEADDTRIDSNSADNTTETPAEAAEEGQAEADTDAQDGDNDNPDATADADDSEEVEIEGERYSLPKKLKDKFLMHADYTRKTMEVADLRKQAEAERQEAAKERETVKTDLKSYAELHAIDLQLEQYKKLNWEEIISSDPTQAMRLQREEQALLQARQARATELSQREQERALKSQQETAKRLQEGVATLQREIKGWSPEYAAKLTDYGKKAFGFSDEFMNSILDPKQVLVLHKAYLYDQLVTKQAQQKSQQPQAKPVAKISGGKANTAPTAFRTDMSDAEYDKWRAAQRKRRSS